MTSFLSDKSTFKAIVAAGIATSIDIVIYKNNNNKATALLATTVGVSNYVAGKISLPDITNGALGTSTMYDVKTIEQRVLELTLSSGSSFVLSKFVFKNMRELPMMQYVGIFLGSSIGAEYICDYTFKDPLSYLS